MTKIKAIETEYKGYRFRSRLEARWAVFFDYCGIPFEYEKEGYNIDGECYLPDFYLPWFNCFVEIKPKTDDDYSEAENKLKKLCSSHDGCITMLCKGDPFDNDMTVYCLDEKDGSISLEPNAWDGAKFLEGVQFEWGGYTKHYISLCLDGLSDIRVFMNGKYKPANITNIHNMTGFRSDFEWEKIKARQARFEHGEKPMAGGT